MLKSLSIGIKLLKSKFINFKSNVRGMFLLITFLLLIPILVYISFVIDGSNMMLDRAQFNRGVEQSTLFLTSENNFTRQTPNPALDNMSKDKRNTQLMADVARYYYRQGNISTGNDSGIKRYEDSYTYHCDYRSDPNNLNSGINYLKCGISAYFYRRSWLFWGGKYTYSDRKGALYGFNQYQKIGNDTNPVYKDTTPPETEVVIPRDTIIIVDRSPNTRYYHYDKIIPEILIDLIRSLLPDNSYNRVAVMLVDNGFRFFGMPQSWYLSNLDNNASWKDRYLPDGSQSYWNYINNIQTTNFPIPKTGYFYSAERPMENLKVYYFDRTVGATPKPTRVKAIEERWWTGRWILQSFGWIYPDGMIPPKSSRCTIRNDHPDHWTDEQWTTLCFTKYKGTTLAGSIYTDWRYNIMGSSTFFFDYL